MPPCLPTRRISTFLGLLPPDPVRSPALLSLTAQGQVRYTLKMPYRDGSTHVAFESLDFIAGLAAVVPAGRVQSGQSGQKPGFARLAPWASLLPMDYLYSLYDALLSIHVPNDKARAVVDAMERDMGTTIATKADLQILRQDLTSLVNSNVSDLRHELRHETGLVRKDMELLSSRMVIQLGSMLVVGFGVMIAALKFLLS